MVVLPTDRSGCGIRLCGRSENSPRTVKIASVSSRASSTYWPLATCTTLLSPLGVASPETTCCTACCRSSRCLSLSGLARSSTRAGPASVSRAGGAPHAVAGTAANNAAPTTTLTALLTDTLLRSEEAALPPSQSSDDHVHAASVYRKCLRLTCPYPGQISCTVDAE